MKQPLVSVVITCYNYGEYVAEAIKSVLRQTYKNVELIIIDDGSSDNSKDEIVKFSERKNVTIVSRNNKGVVYTRNEGVKLSKGDFVMQLDADDTIDASYIEKCVDLAEKKKLDIVYTQARIFGRADFITEHIDYDLEKMKHDNYMHAASLVRVSRLKTDPYDEYLDKLGNEDWDLFLGLCLDGARAGLVDEPLLNYRKHTDRKSRADSFEGFFRETLVRHHIWSKQNAKHPDQFWYFSSQIDKLLESIHLYEHNQTLELRAAEYLREVNAKKQEITEIQKHVKVLEGRDIVTQVRKRMSKIKAFVRSKEKS